MRKNFFFFILNQIFLPLTGLYSIYQFFTFIASKNLEEWPDLIASKMSFSGSFFLRYIIQLSLITNTFQLLSLPKLFYDFWFTHTWYFAKKNEDSFSLAELYKRSAIFANVERNNK
uniref:CSC1/OSCA1-like 7TM region domain-containing protein n=1 Tax=Euplotes harpa TaxID=151035 RepID=A0A7S3J6M6_9SPIT|mmetsp:Transcript_18190/g.20929  ORF Transcript_18190/g.20929 Transcript_18190/m.20929 type:complete len:116 (+) Transcript_18190:239-586(+)